MKYCFFFVLLERHIRSFQRPQFVGIRCGRPAIRRGIRKLIPLSCFIPLSGFLQRRCRPKAPRCLIMSLLPANIIIGRIGLAKIETIQTFDIRAPIFWTVACFRLANNFVCAVSITVNSRNGMLGIFDGGPGPVLPDRVRLIDIMFRRTQYRKQRGHIKRERRPSSPNWRVLRRCVVQSLSLPSIAKSILLDLT